MVSTSRTATHTASWREYALGQLAQAGYNRGASREKVVDLLAGQDCGITALEIDLQLEDVGRATVYRALDQLEDLGLIQRIDLGADSSAYEKVDVEGHHHHLVCTECAKVIPFEDLGLERAILAISKRDRFIMESHEVTLKGICEDCR